jgi:beta-ureidopropionase / N-carbamoyl-L-amino-acid hydrolase
MTALRIDLARLMRRIEALGEIGALDGGGVCRLALTDEDKVARDLVTGWMRDLGLDVTIDRIGNVIGVRPGRIDGPPVMAGSHIDTVATGGLYDGNLGVLAGLEVVETLNKAGRATRHPIAVGFFTNEEGARFAPDMMGSAVHQGALSLADCPAVIGDELARIGYAGDTPVGTIRARAFFELHIEQGPVLENAGVEIGAVTGVQGISWTEYAIEGMSNHAGTTPMRLRHDAGFAAAAIATEARRIARDMGGDQVATSGVITLDPNLVNVIARRATVTVDLRNTDESALRDAERRMADHVALLARDEGVEITARALARFAPVRFDPAMIALIHDTAEALGRKVMRLPSGAGHDAQMFAPNCPTGMIFVPSAGGISHNVREYTAPEQIRAGADVLLQTMLVVAES